MNWTGGRLQQSKRHGGPVNAKQKAYFAKARSKLQDRPRRGPLQLSIFGNVELKRDSEVRSKSSDTTQSVTGTKHTPVQYENDARVAKRHFQGTDDLEMRRKDLLKRSDWLGLEPTRPFTMAFPADRKRARVGRRRRLNTDDLARWEKQHHEKVKRRHGSSRQSLQSAERIIYAPGQGERVSVRFGTSIHGSQWTQLPGTQPRTGPDATPDRQASDEMLFDSSTPSDIARTQPNGNKVNRANSATYEKEREGYTLAAPLGNRNSSSANANHGTGNGQELDDNEMLFGRTPDGKSMLAQASRSSKSTRNEGEEERWRNFTTPKESTDSVSKTPGLETKNEILGHSSPRRGKPSRLAERASSPKSTFSTHHANQIPIPAEPVHPNLIQSSQTGPTPLEKENGGLGPKLAKEQREMSARSTSSSPSIESPAQDGGNARKELSPLKPPRVLALPPLYDENAAWFKFVFGAGYESSQDPEQNPDLGHDSTKRPAIASSLEGNASQPPDAPPSPNPSSSLPARASSPSSMLVNDSSSIVQPESVAQQARTASLNDAMSSGSMDPSGNNVATAGTSTARGRLFTFRKPRRFESGDDTDPRMMKIGGGVNGAFANGRKRMSREKSRGKSKDVGEERIWEIGSSGEEVEEIEG